MKYLIWYSILIFEKEQKKERKRYDIECLQLYIVIWRVCNVCDLTEKCSFHVGDAHFGITGRVGCALSSLTVIGRHLHGNGRPVWRRSLASYNNRAAFAWKLQAGMVALFRDLGQSGGIHLETRPGGRPLFLVTGRVPSLSKRTLFGLYIAITKQDSNLNF